jgi:hypothetical protein
MNSFCFRVVVCFCLLGLLVFLLLMVMAFSDGVTVLVRCCLSSGCSCLRCLYVGLLDGCIDGGSVLIGCGAWCCLLLYFLLCVRWGTLSLI